VDAVILNGDFVVHELGGKDANYKDLLTDAEKWPLIQSILSEMKK
jgi:hypothetical protein